jgi:hypothetical protein
MSNTTQPPRFKSIVVSAPWATYEKRGFTSSTEQADYREINAAKLAENIEGACNALYSDGYSIVSILPFTSGYWEGVQYGAFGFGRTTAVIITAILK